MGITLSVVIITFNEEENIGRCLDSVSQVADEILVIDSFSSDKTREICHSYKTNFIEHRFEGHKEQKNYAMKQANCDYILSLDADEALSPDLRQSVMQVKSNPQFTGYRMNRLSYYQGRWIRHSGWYPDTKLRLVKANSAEWRGENPHDRLELMDEKQIGALKGDLLHFSFKDLTDHARRTNKYASIAAREAFNKKANYSILKLAFNPAFTFTKKFFFQLGFLDGYNGFLIARMAAYGKFLKYAKLREMYHENKS